MQKAEILDPTASHVLLGLLRLHLPPDIPVLLSPPSALLKSGGGMRRKTEREKKSRLNPAARKTSIPINTHDVSGSRLCLLQLPKAAEPPRPG